MRQNIEMFAVFCRAVHIEDGEGVNIAVVIGTKQTRNAERQDWFFILQGCHSVLYDRCDACREGK